MNLTPYNRYRPTRTSDGQGGFTETAGDASTVYGILEYQESEPRFLARRESDIEKGDLIEVAGESYRVTTTRKIDGTDTQEVSLEKVDKPI